MSSERILVIEDDEDIQTLITHNLTREGFKVTVAGNGIEGINKIRQETFDCIVLDLMLPGIDGLEICRQLKKDPNTQHIPITMVTAKGEESDIVTGLELGADDYIIKPFSPRVLVARIRSILRRNNQRTIDSESIITTNDIEIHPGRHEVLCKGKKVDLTYMEFQVLQLLASHPGWVFTRNKIIDNVRNDNYPVTDRSVDVVIVGLRKKLGDNGSLIETVRGVGYRFSEAE
ncbi:MAG TPA: response regulator transcription factor [Chitinispirillaceae bacterium]|nr:response regulator transcription factor [Chitinispirillaceae bacterium]